LLLELRNNGVQEYIECEKVFMTKILVFMNYLTIFVLTLRVGALPTVSPEGEPQQMGEIKDYL